MLTIKSSLKYWNFHLSENCKVLLLFKYGFNWCILLFPNADSIDIFYVYTH